MASAMSSAAPSPTPTIVEARQSRTSLAQEIQRDEARIEKYGGDDPEDPPPKSPVSSQIKEETFDANLVTWDGDNDPENPQNWSRAYKWFVTFVVAYLTVDVTFASSSPTAALTFIARDLHAAPEVTYLITTLFLLGYVVGPIFWGPGSEMFGRRPVTVVTMTLYTLFHLGQALATDMTTLLVTRFFAGFFACAPLINSGGVLADVWDPVGRGPATSVLFTTIFLGPALGPLIGGFVTESYLGWRWVFWVMMIFAGSCTVVGIAFQPETYAPVILARKARRLRKADPVGNKHLYAESERADWSIRAVLHRTIFRPFQMLVKELILVLVTVYLSIVYGVIYALFEAFPVIFIQKRGLTISQDGIIFLGVGLGAALGALLNLYFTRQYPQLMKSWRGFPPPEERLFGAMAGGILLIISIFWLGWTGQYPSVPWYVPMLSTILIGISINLVFMSFLSYLVDTYLMYAASAFAAHTMVRSAVGAAFPLFTFQMFDGMGVNWACTLLGLISVLMAPMPFLFYKYGARIRESSTFAPCIDLKIGKEIEAERRAQKELGLEGV